MGFPHPAVWLALARRCCPTDLAITLGNLSLAEQLVLPAP